MNLNAKEIQNKTTALLKKINTHNITTKDVDDLREVLRFHEYRYYIQNDPLISDFEYCCLFTLLLVL